MWELFLSALEISVVDRMRLATDIDLEVYIIILLLELTINSTHLWSTQIPLKQGLLGLMPQVERLLVLNFGPVADFFPTLGSIRSCKSSMSLSKWVEAVFSCVEYAASRAFEGLPNIVLPSQLQQL